MITKSSMGSMSPGIRGGSFLINGGPYLSNKKVLGGPYLLTKMDPWNFFVIIFGPPGTKLGGSVFAVTSTLVF